MNIGTDMDGRTITFDETAQRFSIAGIPTTVDRIIAYDQGKQIHWVSDEVRTWVQECDVYLQQRAGEEQVHQAQAAREEAARQADVARRRARVVPGYDPSVVHRLSGLLTGMAMTVTVISTVGGVLTGVIFGFALGAISPALMIPGVLLLSLFFGAMAFFLSYLAVMMLKVIAQMMLTVSQIELNTRPVD